MFGREISVASWGVGFLLLFIAGEGCRAPSKSVPAVAEDLPAEVGPAEAKRLLENNQRYVYLDVRTVAEFEAGHVPDSWNVPVLTFNRETGGKERNGVFLGVVERAIPKDAHVIVGCGTGRRSALASDLMRAAGYRRVTNMPGGLLGSHDETGQLKQPGWTTLGFETRKGDGGERSYKALVARPAP